MVSSDKTIFGFWILDFCFFLSRGRLRLRTGEGMISFHRWFYLIVCSNLKGPLVTFIIQPKLRSLISSVAPGRGFTRAIKSRHSSGLKMISCWMTAQKALSFILCRADSQCRLDKAACWQWYRKKQGFVYKVKILPRLQCGVPQDQQLDPFISFKNLFNYSFTHSLIHSLIHLIQSIYW